MIRTITIAEDVAKAKGRIEGELLKLGIRATYSEIFRTAIELAGEDKIVEKLKEKKEK